MSTTGLDVFDSTIQTTNQWLNDITDELGWGDRQLAYHALRATVQALRDRVTVDMAAHLSAQLPLLRTRHLLRGLEARQQSGQSAHSGGVSEAH